MKNIGNKDLLIDMLLRENQQLKQFKAEYLEYETDHRQQVLTAVTEMRKVYEEIKLIHANQIELFEQLVESQDEEITILKARVKALETEGVKCKVTEC